jgi:PAT family beta-lactamase induction signal transducer AmpG
VELSSLETVWEMDVTNDFGYALTHWIHITFSFSPESVYYVYATVIAEQFGYGFGFAAFMMYLIYVDGESKTSHYSIATGFMALGMMLPGMLSGFIQEYLGYGNFFIWVFIATT